MIIRSFANGFEVQDWTEELNVIPNSWGTIGQLGLFADVPVAEHTVTFEEIIKNGALIVDRVRGDRNAMGKDYARKIHSFAVPHFPLDDYISPSDLQGKRAYGSASEADNISYVRARKFERARMNHAWTLEAARAQALTAGTVYAPNGTVTQNWFTEFGKTQTVVDFAFSSATTDVLGQIEKGIAAIQDNAGTSTSMSGVVALCSPTWFAALISHATTKTAFQYYTSTQTPLRERLTANGSAASTAMHREFFYGGVLFIEMRDAYNGTALIPTNTAVMVPQGSDMFKTYFSPANRFGLTNTLGESCYLFEFADPKGTKIEIETESNFVNALLRPELVISITKS
jgi:hypothetical protein